MFRVLIVAVVLGLAGRTAFAQPSYPPPNDAPNPYRAGVAFGELPNGRIPGGSQLNTGAGGVDLAPDGTIWVLDLCGTARRGALCIATLVHFDTSGRVLGSFVGPSNSVSRHLYHGFEVDGDGNVWLAEGGTVPHGGPEGLQVYKYSPQGELLLTFGRRVKDGPDTFTRPAAVLVAPNGDVFVADGRRIVIFDKTGRFIRAWETEIRIGSNSGWATDLALAMDSAGRLFVGDTSNERVHVFDQEGTRLASWAQFGRPSEMFIDRNDILYVVAWTHTEPRTPSDRSQHEFFDLRFGSVKDGRVTGHIPDPGPSTLFPYIAVDHSGHIYRPVTGGMIKVVKK